LGKEKEEKGSGQTLLLIRLDLSINGSKLPSSFVELIESVSGDDGNLQESVLDEEKFMAKKF